MSNQPPFEIVLTFDDVLLVPQESAILPRDVDVSTRLTKDIPLNIPILSAAMDTVTESKLAIALAREGGLGVIHKNLSIEDQTAMVDRVKRSESGMIQNPVSLPETKTIGEAKELMAHYRISGLPVVKGKKLVGILTNRDIRFESDLSLKVRDRMTDKNLVTVPVGTTLEKAKKILQKHRIEKLLVVNKRGTLVGLITVKDIQKSEQFPHACKDSGGRLRVGAAVGVGNNLLERAKALESSDVDVIVVDSAHGHSKGILDAVALLKKHLKRPQVIAGNVATPDGVKALIDAGADAVKVGIGAGASCTTRIIAGVGYPQLSAVLNCVEEAQKEDIPIIADGGIRYSGDIAKALASGADTVMLGSALSGTDEAPGRVIEDPATHTKKKIYRGMTSPEAVLESLYDSDDTDAVDAALYTPPEGQEIQVPYKGSVVDILQRIRGHLRSAVSYAGETSLSAAREKTLPDPLKFMVPLSESSRRESYER